MNHIDTMKLALDHSEPSILSPGWTLVRNEDIAALRSALSEQSAQQEPPAWWPAVENILKEYGLQAIDFVADFKAALSEQPAPVQQEPVAITAQMAIAFHDAITDAALGTDDLMDIMRGLKAAFLHIAAPQLAQRTWVGLSDAQNTVIWANSQSVDEAIRATEKQLMENNK